MPDFEDLILSITGRITHELDFAFERHNEEFANGIRSKFNGAEEASPKIVRMRIDEDGDIAIRTSRPESGTCYVSASSVTIVGWLAASRRLREARGLDELGRTIESFYRERGNFRPERYDVRLYVLARSASQVEVNAALSRSCGAALGNILTTGTPSRIKSGRMSAEFQKDKFSDSVEFEASNDTMELRYIRAGLPKDFASYSEFLLSTDLGGVVDDIKPFAEMIKSGVSVPK